jgi:hypothetical protein
MSEFRSVFGAELNEYLAIRGKALAPQPLKIDRQVLSDFDEFVAASEVAKKYIDEIIVNGWIQRLREKNRSRTVSNEASNLRGFLEYPRYSGADVFMPRCPQWSEDYAPYIFSGAETDKIFRNADEVKTTSDMRFEFPMIPRLLYG